MHSLFFGTVDTAFRDADTDGNGLLDVVEQQRMCEQLLLRAAQSDKTVPQDGVDDGLEKLLKVLCPKPAVELGLSILAVSMNATADVAAESASKRAQLPLECVDHS